MKKENVAIIGASDKAERYAHKAMRLLLERGHNVYLVNPNHSEIEGHKVYKDISSLSVPIDTVTMYVSPHLQDENLETEIREKKPKRVIFNPGTENFEFEDRLIRAQITAERACTLVLLNTDQF